MLRICPQVSIRYQNCQLISTIRHCYLIIVKTLYLNFLRCCDCANDLDSVIIDDDLHNGNKSLSDKEGRDLFSTNTTNTCKYSSNNNVRNSIFLWFIDT